MDFRPKFRIATVVDDRTGDRRLVSKAARLSATVSGHIDFAEWHDFACRLRGHLTIEPGIGNVVMTVELDAGDEMEMLREFARLLIHSEATVLEGSLPDELLRASA